MRGRRPIILVLYVVAVSLFFEICVRWAVSHEGFLMRLYTDEHEAFWRLWWVQRVRPSDSDVFYSHQYNPNRGWAICPNLRDIHPFPTQPEAVLNTNARGLRGIQDFDYARRPGLKRIAILGDSFFW